VLLHDGADLLVKPLLAQHRVLVIIAIQDLLDEIREKLVLNVQRMVTEKSAVELLVFLGLALLLECFY
jgi:hypothetical protein